MIRYAPSLMCANYLFLEKDIKEMDKANVDFYHIDIMDGHFVPNLSLNFDIVRQIRKVTNTPMDIHLMVDNPYDYIEMLEKIEAEYVSFHIETVRHPIRLVKELNKRNIKVGVAISPATGLEPLEYIIKDLDYVVLMTVEPGYAGQKFIPSMLNKIEKLSEMRNRLNPNLLIEVDGNISDVTAKQCIEAGADILVLGTSSVFKGNKNLSTSIIEFKNIVETSVVKLAE